MTRHIAGIQDSLRSASASGTTGYALRANARRAPQGAAPASCLVVGNGSA